MLGEESGFCSSYVGGFVVEEAFCLPYEGARECIEECPPLSSQGYLCKQAVKVNFYELKGLSLRSVAVPASSFGDMELKELPEDLVWRLFCRWVPLVVLFQNGADKDCKTFDS